MFAFGVFLLAGAMELLARSVTIDDEFVSSRSPLGICRQKLRRADIADVRVGSVHSLGRVVEILFQGRWIVFVGNARFKECPLRYLAAEGGSKWRMHEPTTARGPASSSMGRTLPMDCPAGQSGRWGTRSLVGLLATLSLTYCVVISVLGAPDFSKRSDRVYLRERDPIPFWFHFSLSAASGAAAAYFTIRWRQGLRLIESLEK
jgi:hypothetical protein